MTGVQTCALPIWEQLDCFGGENAVQMWDLPIEKSEKSSRTCEKTLTFLKCDFTRVPPPLEEEGLVVDERRISFQFGLSCATAVM